MAKKKSLSGCGWEFTAVYEVTFSIYGFHIVTLCGLIELLITFIVFILYPFVIRS